MKPLGAVLAGGLSTRFGSDKAMAELGGVRLLDRAVASLAHFCDHVIVVGRDDPAHICVPDWPEPHCGPLGGLAGALRHARDHGFDTVLSCGVDSLALPSGLPDLLGPAPGFLGAQPVIGLWPVAASATLEAMLTGPGSRAVKAFAERIGAHAVDLEQAPYNVNRVEDLDRLQSQRH